MILNLNLAPLELFHRLKHRRLRLIPADGRQLGKLFQHFVQQGIHTLADGSHNGKEPIALLLDKGLKLSDLLLRGQVALIACHQHGPLGQLRIEPGQLPVDDLKILLGIPALTAGDVHHMDEQPAALHMAQELMPQTHAFPGSLNQAGNVSHDKGLSLGHGDHTQHGSQRSEMVIGNVGLGLADH